jgi:hypothetical protein
MTSGQSSEAALAIWAKALLEEILLRAALEAPRGSERIASVPTALEIRVEASEANAELLLHCTRVQGAPLVLRVPLRGE